MTTKSQAKAAECARETRKQAALLAPGKIRDALLEKLKQYEAEIPDETARFASASDGCARTIPSGLGTRRVVSLGGNAVRMPRGKRR
jgi:hypothetical protein